MCANGRFASVIGCTLAAAILFSSTLANAQTHRIGSCYAALPKLGLKPPVPRRVVTILIDRTITYDAALKDDLLQKIEALLTPDVRILVATFSAYGQGDYARVVLDGRIERALTEAQRYWISKPMLQSFDRCLEEQSEYMSRLVPNDISLALAGSNAKFSHTDIVGTLNQLSSQIAGDHGAVHDLVVVSDMLENSDLANFYRKNDLRLLNPGVELTRVRHAGFVPNLGGTLVYVEGPAFSLRGRRVPDKNFQALKAFWASYFAASNAQLIDFGTPLLHGPIR